MHPVAVVLEEVLQFPNVLQQVGVCGAIAQALLEQLRALGHAGDVLHQNFLLVGRNLGAGDWETKERETLERRRTE